LNREDSQRLVNERGSQAPDPSQVVPKLMIPVGPGNRDAMVFPNAMGHMRKVVNFAQILFANGRMLGFEERGDIPRDYRARPRGHSRVC
jgi:hypothetical protein